MLPENVHTIVVHCSATGPDRDIGRDEIDLWHRQRGWWGIGYHHVVRRDGTVEPGRPLHVQGAHVRGNNYDTWGICMVGGVGEDGQPEDNFTDAQYQSLRLMIGGYRGYAGKKIKCLGHRDFSPDLNGDGQITKEEWTKACPCFEIADKLKEWGIK